jgi:Flp pilus assembly protein TadG
MVEFALVAPLLVLLLIGIIELGIVVSVYIGITNSAREAARAASVFQYRGSAPLSGDTAAVAAIDGARQLYMSGVLTSTLNPIISPSDLTVSVSYTPTVALATNAYRAGDTVAVQLQVNRTLLFGMLGQKTITLRANSAMRVEPGGNQ